MMMPFIGLRVQNDINSEPYELLLREKDIVSLSQAYVTYRCDGETIDSLILAESLSDVIIRLEHAGVPVYDRVSCS